MKKVGIATFPLGKQSIEVTLQVTALFLGSLLVFSMVQGSVDLMAFTISLMMTYIFVHFWQRQVQKTLKLHKVRDVNHDKSL